MGLVYLVDLEDISARMCILVILRHASSGRSGRLSEYQCDGGVCRGHWGRVCCATPRAGGIDSGGQY